MLKVPPGPAKRPRRGNWWPSRPHRLAISRAMSSGRFSPGFDRYLLSNAARTRLLLLFAGCICFLLQLERNASSEQMPKLWPRSGSVY